MITIFVILVSIGVCSNTVQKDFESICSQFATMFKDVFNDLTSLVEIDEIKNHVAMAYRDLKLSICGVKTKDELYEVLRDNCSFTNYTILIILAEKFKSEKSLSEIALFTKKRDEYYNTVLAQDFAKIALEVTKKQQDGRVQVNCYAFNKKICTCTGLEYAWYCVYISKQLW